MLIAELIMHTIAGMDFHDQVLAALAKERGKRAPKTQPEPNARETKGGT